MINNEKAFTFPLMLALLTVFLLVFTMNVNLLLTERKMLQEVTAVWKEEYYMLSAIKKVENNLQLAGSAGEIGKLLFKYGKVEYSLESSSGNMKKLNFTVSLDTGHTFTGSAFYDTNLKKMVRWIEKN